LSPKTTILLWKDIHEIADAVCANFGLTYGRILPERNVRAKHYGECYPCDKCCNSAYINEINCREKILSLRIHQLNRPKLPLATSTILRTLAHELAHLREWNHGSRHKQFEREILDYIVELGYEVT